MMMMMVIMILNSDDDSFDDGDDNLQFTMMSRLDVQIDANMQHH